MPICGLFFFFFTIYTKGDYDNGVEKFISIIQCFNFSCRSTLLTAVIQIHNLLQGNQGNQVNLQIAWAASSHP